MESHDEDRRYAAATTRISPGVTPVDGMDVGGGMWLLLIAAWLGAAGASGLVAATAARSVHEGVSFRRAWLFYSVLSALFVAVVLLVGLF